MQINCLIRLPKVKTPWKTKGDLKVTPMHEIFDFATIMLSKAPLMKE